MKTIINISLVLLAITLLVSACKKDPILIPAVVEGECPFDCLNGGTCIEGKNRCDCPPEYTGAQCQYPITPCVTVSCYNDGTCINGICECADGWTGVNCTVPASVTTDINIYPIEVCPVPISGGNEDIGNNATINIKVNAEVQNSREIYVRVEFTLSQSSGNNPTVGQGNDYVRVYTAPTGKKITEIIGNSSCEITYQDDDTHIDIIPGEALVSSFEVMGNTPGADLDNCQSGSRLKVNFDMAIGLIEE